MWQMRIEIEGIARLEIFQARAHFQRQPAFQHVDEFHSGMLMQPDLFGGDFPEIGEVRIEFTVNRQKIQRFKIEGDVLGSGNLEKTQAAFLSCGGVGVTSFFVAKK
jgi:hypothetical protein